jgi:hypothetical protein
MVQRQRCEGRWRSQSPPAQVEEVESSVSQSALSASSAASAGERKEEWLALGFQEGPPLRIPPESRTIDRRVGLVLRCPAGAVKRRGAQSNPCRPLARFVTGEPLSGPSRIPSRCLQMPLSSHESDRKWCEPAPHGVKCFFGHRWIPPERLEEHISPRCLRLVLSWRMLAFILHPLTQGATHILAPSSNRDSGQWRNPPRENSRSVLLGLQEAPTGVE